MRAWLRRRRRQRQQRILTALHGAGQPLSTYLLGRAAGLPAGSLFADLLRLEDAGWITSRWEVLPPGELRPRRRLYELTDTGRAAARAVADTNRSSQ